MCNSVILCDIARPTISHQISEFLKRQLLYNIPYHSASLLDVVHSLSLKERRKGMNDLNVIGDQYDIMFQNDLGLNHSDWFVETWHSFTL